MNKTLLLIIIDFLFLNLIALTRWEKVEPARAQQPPVPQIGANAATKDQDLVDTMRQSLADEAASRRALEDRLARAGSDLSQREQGLTQLQAERARLAAALADTQRGSQQLAQQAQAARQESSLTQEQLATLERELEQRRAEAERQNRQLEEMRSRAAEFQEKIAGLNTRVALTENERQHLAQQASQLSQQVEQERADRRKVEAQTTQLAQGVGQLAQSSGALTKEIRENRPINENVLFNDFLSNRVDTHFTATRRGLFGQQVVRAKDTPTVLVSDGKQIYALLHIDDTAFSDWQQNFDWTKIGVSFNRPPTYHATASQLDFLAVDPRVVVVPVSMDEATALGAKAYPLAADPFRFGDAVLVNGGRGFGVVTFKLDPANPGYVRVDNRFFRRLLGNSDVRPSRGDLVFSHTGELLGIMVNRDYCALLRDFTAASTLHTGDNTSEQHTAQTLDAIASRVRTMPPGLQ